MITRSSGDGNGIGLLLKALIEDIQLLLPVPILANMNVDPLGYGDRGRIIM